MIQLDTKLFLELWWGYKDKIFADRDMFTAAQWEEIATEAHLEPVESMPNGLAIWRPNEWKTSQLRLEKQRAESEAFKKKWDEDKAFLVRLRKAIADTLFIEGDYAERVIASIRKHPRVAETLGLAVEDLQRIREGR